MKNRIYLKFLFAYLIFGLLGFTTVATLTSNMTLKYLQKQRADTLYKEASLIASNYADGYYNGDISIMVFHNHLKLADTYISATIWLTDTKGNVIVSSRDNVASVQKIIPDFDPTNVSNNFYQTGNFYGLFDEDVLSVMYPITQAYKVKGYIIIHTPMRELYHNREQILTITYITFAIIFALSLIILLVFIFIVYFPIKKITAAANEYAKGNLTYEIKLNQDDEIGKLADTLNYMASELNESEEYQRKFISNVSHDFRSPLTSMKGYVEAILDGTIPVEIQDKYLKIILFETERLTKLTGSLLTLNNFGSKSARLDKTDFDINEIIKSTAATFEGICREKKISIELVLTGHHLSVSADMGKIQQVLYNLIDNAIKFSTANSSIRIETTEKNGKVFVSVKDTGIGIPKESLKKIWERFYKTDLSRGRDRKGLGLGLSIVKEVIQAHGENINVISTEGVGTEFIFTLPLSKKESLIE